MGADITTDDLLPEVEKALSLLGMNATKFGLLCLNDPKLVGELRLGRKVRPHNRKRIRDFIRLQLRTVGSQPSARG